MTISDLLGACLIACFESIDPHDRAISEASIFIRPAPSEMRLVSKVLAVPDPPKVRLYKGFPPQLDPDPKARQMMPPADVLLIERDEVGNGFFLVRYTAAGGFAGDTWHLNLEDTKHQADFEFAGLITPWIPVPSEVTDIVSYALTSADD